MNPSGATNEYVSLVNTSTSASLTVTASSGTGYSVAASDGAVRCLIPNGTVIPPGGHYLCVNSTSYGLSSYPAGDGTTATGDGTFTTDIPDNTGIALFTTSLPANYSVATRLDAAGFTSEANTLYKEGTGIPTINPTFNIDHAFLRDRCGKGGSITTAGPCTQAGLPKDTDNNAADFIFVDTNGTSAGAGQRLGAPGPRNLGSPTFASANITAAPIDTCAAPGAAPNKFRDYTVGSGSTSSQGTVDIRAKFTNNTGAPLTRLRFRIVDLTTFPAPSGFADLRPISSSSTSVTVDNGAPCGSSGTSMVAVQGTTLEQPPNQPNGGGFNSSLGANVVTAGTPLANGATINVRFTLGVQQPGAFRFAIIPEALPQGGLGVYAVSGATNGPSVVSIVRADPDPVASGAIVHYTVTFDAPVTGVDAADFALTNTGSIAGDTITNVTGSGTTYTVTVNTGTGTGTIRLDLIDNDTIQDGASQPLGGTGAANGNYTSGEVYTVNAAPPSVTSIVRADPDPVASGAIVHYTVTFSESVTGVDATDFALTNTGTIAGATITNVSGSGAVYTVTVNTGTGAGTIRLDVIDDDSIVNGSAVPLGGAGAGNGNFTTGQVYTVVAPPVVSSIVRADPDPVASGSIVHYTVTFSQAVTGVDAGDFTLTNTGSIAGDTITNVSGSGTTYTVTVNTGTGTGTVRLDVVDNDTIVNGSAIPLGGPGAGNGNFTSGQVYTVSAPPTVTSITYTGVNPTVSGSPLTFNVVFSQPVTGVDASDFALTTTGAIAGASITSVTGSGANYTVTVNSGTGAGTIRLDLVDNDSIVNGSNIPLGGPGAGNGNAQSGVVTVIAGSIPTLSTMALALLGCLLAFTALLTLKRF